MNPEKLLYYTKHWFHRRVHSPAVVSAGAFFPDSSSTRVSFSVALSSWSSSQPGQEEDLG